MTNVDPQKSSNKIVVVQGAQWGSEAKGVATAFICLRDNSDYCVRGGTVNAGHTAYYKGKPYVMQQLPVGWVNPNTCLIIAPGAYVHPFILAREIAAVNVALGLDIRKHQLIIDSRCGLHLPLHTERATTADRHHKMGATGKGCSEAVMSKIRDRGAGGQLFIDWLKRDAPFGSDYYQGAVELLEGCTFADTAQLLNDAWDGGARIVIEGTQGTLLDLHLGPYPYTTHKQTACGNWIAECGLSPSLPYEVCLVARTYPIRVAGNSGPMPGEVSWPTLTRRVNARLQKCGLPPRVREESIQAFELACKQVAAAWVSRDGPDTQLTDSAIARHDTVWLSEIERWSQAARELAPKYVSELHKEALALLPGDVAADLAHMFELTTVTKKLRRVADLDAGLLEYSCMLNRPAYLFLTFANYVFPEIWGMDAAAFDWCESMKAVSDYATGVERKAGGVPVRYITTGPESEHVIERRNGLVGQMSINDLYGQAADKVEP